MPGHDEKQPADAGSAGHEAARVLRWVNARSSTDFVLVRALHGGRQGGAWLVRPGDGPSLVLKWSRNPGLALRRQQAMSAVVTLRGRGYPTPAWAFAGTTADGVAYVLQDLAPGTPGDWATVLLDEVCAAVELQAGLGAPGHPSWSSFVEWVVRDDAGPRGRLRATPAGRTLLAHYDGVLAAHGPVAIPQDDLVHGDLNTSNVLVAAGHLTALIDIDAIGSGCRAVDYAWLLREAFTVGAPHQDKELLRTAGRNVAGPAVFASCVAATAFDITVFESWTDPDPSWRPGGSPLDALHLLAEFVRAG